MHLKQLHDVIQRVSFSPERLDNDLDSTILHLTSSTDAELDRARAIAKHVLSKEGDIEQPLMMMDFAKVLVQLARWKRCLPRVAPFYAVKCNPDPVLVAFLQSVGVNFDCATSEEMELVVNKLGHNPDNVIYSNPCKLPSHIRFSRDCGVKLTIIDNMDEVGKIKRNHPEAEVLIRLACADSSSLCPMSCKFGATNDRVQEILSHAMDLQLKVVGVHFHVGSGCSDPNTYHKALLDARRAFDLGLEIGHNMHVLDLGGGFPGLGLDGTCRASSGTHFEEMADVINNLIDQLFPEDPSSGSQFRIMAEPGRFMCAGSSALLTKVHSKCKLDDETVRYYLNDGLYGCFNCIIFDHVELKPETLDDRSSEARGPKNVTLFGPTCDGLDKIMDTGVNHLPELEIEDRLIWLKMGAYTTASSTTFNGFPKAKYFYYHTV
jgi:ornithine decarboxylase